MSEQIFSATYNGIPGEIITRGGGMCEKHPHLETYYLGLMKVCYNDLTNIRPLRIVQEGQIVLSADADLLADLLLRCVQDPSDPIHDRRKLSRGASVVNAAIKEENTVVIGLIEQINAQTKPERMKESEPLTEGQFNPDDSVMAARRYKGVTFSARIKRTLCEVNGERKWVHIYADGTISIADWSDLIEPALIRDGI